MRSVLVGVLLIGCGFRHGAVATGGDAGAVPGDALGDARADAMPDALVLGAWGTPVHVDELSSVNDDAASAMSTDGLKIVLVYDAAGTNAHIYRSHRDDTATAWATPVPLASVNSSTGGDYSPMFSADELTIYFDST